MKILNPKMEEKAILSVLMSSPQIKVEMLSWLNPEHFGYRPMHAAFLAVKEMMEGSALDLPQLETFLGHPGLMDDAVTVLKKPSTRPVKKVSDAKRLFDILETYRKRRVLYAHVRDLTSQFEDESDTVDIDEVANDIETTLLSLRSESQEEKMYHAGKGDDSDEMVKEVFSDEKPRLVPSTFANFDRITQGFGANDLVILASHMKGGKSIMSLNIGVEQYLRHNLDVIYVPLEMSKQETVERLISKISTVEHTKVRTKTWNPMEKKQAMGSWNAFKEHGVKNNCRFTVWPVASITVAQLRMRLKPMNYDVVIIDYLNLLIDPTNNPQEWLRLGNFARDLKLVTKEIDSLIIAPTQMNMDGEIRYSKAIKEHANTVWTWVYGEEEQGTHTLTINQPAVRGWSPFKFQLKEDFARMEVRDHLGSDLSDDDIDMPINETMKGI